MGLGWPVIFRPLEGGTYVGLLLSSNALGNDRLKRPALVLAFGSDPWIPGRQPCVLVAPAERFNKERRSDPLTVELGLHADCCQIPMRFAWVVGSHLAKHGVHILHDVVRQAFVQDGPDRILVRLHAGGSHSAPPKWPSMRHAVPVEKALPAKAR